MTDATHIGTAWAWQEGDLWRYLTEPYFAPDESEQCELVELEGELLLHRAARQGGEFIRGAVDAQKRSNGG
jgi:hypothetical protein